MDKSQVRSCISGSGSITYDPLTGIIGGGGGGGATWGSITGTLSAQTDLQSALDAKQNESIVINSNTTAVLDGVYTVVASATFTDPTPAEGKGFMVFVRNGTATIGGIGYSTLGSFIYRIYHSGAWANYNISSGTTGSWELISTATASSSSTIDFTGLSSTYAFYKVVYYDVLPVTNSVSFRIRLGTGGTPTYDTGNNYGWAYVFAQNGASGGGGSATDSSINLVNATVSNNSQRAIYGDVTIYNPSQSSTYHVIDYNFNMQNDTSALITRTLGQGTYRSTTAVTAIRLYFSSGNIASGVFKLYGIR
jgi:hypothetical protein